MNVPIGGLDRMYESWYQLPPDVNTWYSVIVDNLTRKIPEIPKYMAGIELNKFDPVLGDADGTVYLMGGVGAIPIIIRQLRLAPMDIMMGRKDDFYPVNEVFIQKLYADNAIGEPSKGPQDDMNMDGPAKRVIPKHLLKSASAETVKALKETVMKSASLMSFFNEHDQDFLVSLVTYDMADKVAAEDVQEPTTESPALHFIAKDDAGYFYNGEPITAKLAGELMAQFCVPQEKRAEILLDGGIVCVDERKDLSTIVAMTNDDTQDKTAAVHDANILYGTAVDANGVPHLGVMVRVHDSCASQPFETRPKPNTIEGLEPSSNWLFVTPTLYAYQHDIKLLDAVPVDADVVAKVLQPIVPYIGATITIKGGESFCAPFTVAQMVKSFQEYRLRSTMGEEHFVNSNNVCYLLPDNFVRLPSTDMELFMDRPGENYTVVSDGQGRYHFGGREFSYTNTVYRLMHDIDLSLEDTRGVMHNVLTNGSTKLKTAASPKKQDKSKAKVTEKATKEQQSAEKEQFKLQEQQAKQQQVQGNQQFQEQQRMFEQQQLLQQNSMAPVSFDDMQDVAKLNDPTMMDAYLSGKLTDVNVMGREQMMHISDNLVNAIKSVAKLLYLIRQGKIDYINEEDTSMALSKMGDVIKSVGVSTTQVTN